MRAVVKPARAAGNARQIAQTGLIDPLEIEDHVACQQTVATEILDAFKRDRPQFLVDGFKGEREGAIAGNRSEEHTSELQSLMRISYAVFCLQKKKTIYAKTPSEMHRHRKITQKTP